MGSPMNAGIKTVDPLLTLDMILIAGFLIAVFIAYTRFAGGVKKERSGKPNKFPSPFESKLSREVALDVLVERLTHLQTLKPSWTITEKVVSVGRLQARMTVPMNISGGTERVSFLINLLVSQKGDGSNIEWSYVVMSAVSLVGAEMDLFEDDIYKRTSMEIRIALFERQGEHELADHIKKQLAALPGKGSLEKREHESLFGNPVIDTSPVAEKSQSGAAGAVPKPTTKNPDTVQQKTTDVESVKHGYQFSVDTTTGAPASSASSLRADAGGARNSASAENNALIDCPKCKQKRDPNFKFCLYCGQADS